MNGTINGTEQRPGVVTAISPDIVTVQIQQQSACSGCHARDLCVSSECREHLLQLKTYGQHFSIGEQVLVVARRSVGRLAVLLAFVLPLLLLVLTLSIAQTFLALSEAAAVLVAIGLLSLYYLVLYTQRRRLEGASSLWWSPSPRSHDRHPTPMYITIIVLTLIWCDRRRLAVRRITQVRGQGRPPHRGGR